MKKTYTWEMETNSCLCCPLCYHSWKTNAFYCTIGMRVIKEPSNRGFMTAGEVGEVPSWCPCETEK